MMIGFMLNYNMVDWKGSKYLKVPYNQKLSLATDHCFIACKINIIEKPSFLI